MAADRPPDPEPICPGCKRPVSVCQAEDVDAAPLNDGLPLSRRCGAPVSAAVPRVVRTVEGIPPAAVPPAEPPDARRILRSLTDMQLTQLQETGSVVVGHVLVAGVRLTAITNSLLLLGIDPEDVVLRGTFAVAVSPDA